MIRALAIMLSMLIPAGADAQAVDKMILPSVTTWNGSFWESWSERYFVVEPNYVFLPWGAWVEYETVREVTRAEWMETEIPDPEE